MDKRTLLPVCALFFFGCASAAPAVPTATSIPSAPSPTSAATLPASVGPSVAPPTSLSVTPAPTRQSNAATVNLVFTGAYAFTAVGTGGRCPNPLSASGQPALFGFDATEADFPGMGQSYSMFQGTRSSTYVDVKWVIEGKTAFGLPGPATPGAKLGTVTLSADQRSVTIDTDLAEFSATPRPEHVSGTIDCPK